MSCSLVEIKNINEIYIHYLDTSEGHTSDRADSIDSLDNGDVTINNCSVIPPSLPVDTSDMAVQVDITEDREKSKEKSKTSITSIG